MYLFAGLFEFPVYPWCAPMSEPELQRVVLTMCSTCLDGEGGECHTPGCALWMNRAPDVSIRDKDETDEFGLREGMYPRSDRRVRMVNNSLTHTALCRDDRCPWKHRGVTADATWKKAEGHAILTGHHVRVYSEAITELNPLPSSHEMSR